MHRAGGGATQLPQPAGDGQRRIDHGLRRGPPRVRVPLRGRRLCGGLCGARPAFHRAACRGPRALRQQVRRSPHARRQRPAHRPWQPRHHPRPLGCARAGGGGRLPSAPQAISGRRGPRHAPDSLSARDGDLPAARPLRGAGGIRRRLDLLREVDRGEPAHRDPGPGRQLRDRDPARRARLQRPAQAPEDHRGGSIAGPDR